MDSTPPSPRGSGSGGGDLTLSSPSSKRMRFNPEVLGHNNNNNNNGTRKSSTREDEIPSWASEQGNESSSGPEKPAKGSSTSFRNVSACNRCRLRKNKCDQDLPSCQSCWRAGVKCVGYDPITKREIPRSYVYHLETRIDYLERLLRDNSISFTPGEDLDQPSRPGSMSGQQGAFTDTKQVVNGDGAVPHQLYHQEDQKLKHVDAPKANSLVSNDRNVSRLANPDSRYLGSTSGISFARVMLSAVNATVSTENHNTKASVKPEATSMRDSFFGLHTKPTFKPAPFPEKVVATRLVGFYFEIANPQNPILHRGEFMKLFEAAYSDNEEQRVRTDKVLYMLNIVFAIGAGIFLNDTRRFNDSHGEGQEKQAQPEGYHASAIVHLEGCMNATDKEGFSDGLEELQAVLLLASFALLRPVAPGLWYIVGVAIRLAVDLGLHYEDRRDIEAGRVEISEGPAVSRQHYARERGRRDWTRDFRRRLFWSTYAFDRGVSTCVGRPFGVTDLVITTEFPSIVDDDYITPEGFLPCAPRHPSYKYVSHHYFRLRLLQSEILQVLQYQQAQHARSGGANATNPWMLNNLPSPFLIRFGSFRSWRHDIDTRLSQWLESAPTKAQTGVAFSTVIFELNYWQCIIMLYRQSLSTPPQFEREFNTSREVNDPTTRHAKEAIGDEERVFLKVAEAGQKVLRIYRKLHVVHLVSYTFMATHHLFSAGIAFLFAIWHSPSVRRQLTMEEVDFILLAGKSVLRDLIEKCPPAEACRDAFDRMSKSTVEMVMATTGFGTDGPTRRPESHSKLELPGAGQLSDTEEARRRHSNESVAMSRSVSRFSQAVTSSKASSDTASNSSYPPSITDEQLSPEAIYISASSSSINQNLLPPPLIGTNQAQAPNWPPTIITSNAHQYRNGNATAPFPFQQPMNVDLSPNLTYQGGMGGSYVGNGDIFDNGNHGDWGFGNVSMGWDPTGWDMQSGVALEDGTAAPDAAAPFGTGMPDVYSLGGYFFGA